MPGFPGTPDHIPPAAVSLPEKCQNPLHLMPGLWSPRRTEGVLREVGALSLMELTPASDVYSPWSPAVSPEVIILWPQLWGMAGSHIPALLACWVRIGLVAIGVGVGQAGLAGSKNLLQALLTIVYCGQIPGLLYHDSEDLIWIRKPGLHSDNVESSYFPTKSSPFEKMLFSKISIQRSWILDFPSQGLMEVVRRGWETEGW